MYLPQIIVKRKITKAKKTKNETKSIKPKNHRPSWDREKLVNSPFSSFKGTYGCRPNKNRATKNAPKGNDARTDLFFVIYIYI